MDGERSLISTLRFNNIIMNIIRKPYLRQKNVCMYEYWHRMGNVALSFFGRTPLTDGLEFHRLIISGFISNQSQFIVMISQVSFNI